MLNPFLQQARRRATCAGLLLAFVCPLPAQTPQAKDTPARKSRDRRVHYAPSTSHLGSPYVSLESWVYPAFDRLAAAGLVESGFLGMRPWTRRECARLVREAEYNQSIVQLEGTWIGNTLAALKEEFKGELSDDAAPSLKLGPIYLRTDVIPGAAANRSLHFSSSLVNAAGRPYGDGFNGQAGAAVRGNAGRFSFYTQGEVQHWAATPALSPLARQLISVNDDIPGYTEATLGAGTRVRLVESQIGFTAARYQLSFGKQSLWWGPGRSGSLLISNNAEAVAMLRLNRTEPLVLPGPFRLLGPMRVEFFIGQLGGHRYIRTAAGLFSAPIRPRPYIHGERFAFRPTPNLEVGLSSTTVFGGSGYPLTLRTFLRSYGINNTFPGAANDPGDRRSGMDFSYRIPGLRRWLTIYSDAYTEDEFSPIAYPGKSAFQPGLYLTQVPGLPSADLRVEGVFTDLPRNPDVRGIHYFNFRFLDGYTNQQRLLAHWVGRRGVGLWLQSRYHLSAKERVEVTFRRHTAPDDFLAGGSLTNFSLGLERPLRPDLVVAGTLQVESWRFPALKPGRQTHVMLNLQLRFENGWTWRRR